jgi:hypothetical protein
MAIDLAGRIKHEVAKGVVRAVLKEAGYRVISSGMESVLREVSCLTDAEYKSLNLPMVARRSPDFVVMDREMTTRQMVEVKYRDKVDRTLFDSLTFELRYHPDFTLVLMFGGSQINQAQGNQDLNRFIRYCELRRIDDRCEIALYDVSGTLTWQVISGVASSALWDGMRPLSQVFPGVFKIDPGVEVSVDYLALSLARRVP